MDNQNNNFENINNIPREPDFPPKAPEDVVPQQNVVAEEVSQENATSTPQENENTADIPNTQQESETAFKENSTNNINFGENSQADDDLGIPDIPTQSFQNSYNSVNYQNQQATQPQQNYQNNQPFSQNNSGVNYPYGINMPSQVYNPNNQYSQYNPQNTYSRYSQQGYTQPYMQNNNVNMGYPYNQGYQPYANSQFANHRYNQNPYNNSANTVGMANSPMNQPPKKTPTGLKVFLICLVVLFGLCLVGFVAMLSYSLGQSSLSPDRNGNSIIPTNGYDYFDPTVEDEEHTESDYSDKINPDYAGLKLDNSVSDKNNSKYNSEYTYNAISQSVVGVVCYYDEITDVSRCATQGSGIIISKDGYIVTNSHIIDNSKTAYAIQVITSDGKEYTAGVVAYDARTDIALLKADATDLKPATFGKSEDMSVGSGVVAIGNPGGIGYQNSMTSGVISAVNRTVPSNTNVKYIQTDAAINPGNSGGPLCNLYGQIIGMNTSKIVSEQYEGMGFAIPSETIKTIVDELMKNGYIKGRVKMGLLGVAVSRQEQEMYDLPAGILVDSVEPDGPLKDSGIQTDDVITKIDGESVSNFGDVFAILEKHKSGDKIKLEVYRSPYISYEEKTFEVEVTLIEDKAE